MPYSIDTLQFYERLKKTNLEESAAREIAEMFRETSEGVSAELATRREIESIIQKEIEVLRSEFKKGMEVLRGEFQKGMGILRKEIEVVRKEIAESKTETVKKIPRRKRRGIAGQNNVSCLLLSFSLCNCLYLPSLP